jgi:hypothetical protein
MKLTYTLIVCSGLLVNVKAQGTATPLMLEKTIPLEKVGGRIDHMAADVAGQRLFIAALGNDTVEVVDLKAGKKIQSLPSFAEPQGIVYIPEYDRLFVANGSDGTCRILDGHSFKTIKTVELGDDADNVRYDESAKEVTLPRLLASKTSDRILDVKFLFSASNEDSDIALASCHTRA